MSLRIYYRLSDKGRNVDKPAYINLNNCLKNFLACFKKENISIIADNIEEETFEYLTSLQLSTIHRTNTGNAKGFIETVQRSIKENDDSTIIYLVEDDYLHLPGSENAIKEGLQIADYVTLYDNPDKYRNDGPNPHITQGGEASKVFLTKSVHWKLTNSTCMTFAGRVQTFKRDFKTMSKWSQKGEIPNDFKMWTELIKKKKRKLISPIPGYATHGMSEYLAPLSDWQAQIPTPDLPK